MWRGAGRDRRYGTWAAAGGRHARLTVRVAAARPGESGPRCEKPPLIRGKVPTWERRVGSASRMSHAMPGSRGRPSPTWSTSDPWCARRPATGSCARSRSWATCPTTSAVTCVAGPPAPSPWWSRRWCGWARHAGHGRRGGPTRTIALVVPALQNPYFARLAEGMQVAARERGYTVSVEVSLGIAETERAHVRGLTARPVDAVIISPTALDPAELLVPGGPRVVLLGEMLPAAPEVSHVAIDNVASAADVVRLLVAHGRRRLLFLGAEGSLRSTGTDRLAGFRAATRVGGLDPDPELTRTVRAWTREDG